MHIYILNGTAASGKDLFASNVCTLCGAHGKILSTIDPIKEAATIAGWNGEKDEESRRNLNRLKNFFTGWLDTSFNYIEREVRRFEDFIETYQGNVEDIVIFIMCREPNEIRRLKEAYNAKTVLIRRAEAEDHRWNNPADDDVLLYDYDIEIHNNGTLYSFALKAHDFCITEGIKFCDRALNGFKISEKGQIYFEERKEEK